MKQSTHRLVIAAFAVGALFPVAALLAQDAPADAKQTLFKAACEAMAKFEALAASTRHRTENPMFEAPGADATVAVEVVKHGDLLVATANKGRDTIITRGRKTIVRAGEGEFRYSRDKLAEGGDMPHVVDPEYVFAVLRHAQGLSLVHSEVGTLDDKPIQILTLTASHDAADRLRDSGILPACRGSGVTGGLTMFVGKGGKTAATFDIAVFVDPATKRVARLRLKSYEESPLAGRARIVRGAGGAVQVTEPSAEDDDESDQQKGPAFKDGLPVRKGQGFKDATMHTLDVTFRDLGTAAAPKLDDAAQALLR